MCGSGSCFCAARAEKEGQEVEKGEKVWYTLPILKTRHIFLCRFLKGERF